MNHKGKLSLWLIDSCLLPVPLYGLSSLCVCVLISFVQTPMILRSQCLRQVQLLP